MPVEKWLESNDILPIVVSCFNLNVSCYSFRDAVSKDPEMTWLAKSERQGKSSFQYKVGFKSSQEMAANFDGPIIFIAYYRGHFWYLRLKS